MTVVHSMTIFEQFEKLSLSTNEQAVANYILQNSSSAVTMSIKELANAAFTSTTTIIRLCKKLGFHGYKEFKIQLSKDVSFEMVKEFSIDVNAPFSVEDTSVSISQKIAYLTKTTINSCLKHMDYQIIEKVVQCMLEAENLLAIAVSDSFIRILDFQLKMMKINTYVKISILSPDQAYLCANATNKDFAMMVSYSGKTAEVINEAKILKQRGVKMVALTSNIDSPLARLSDLVLLLPNEEDKATATYSFSSQLAIEYTLNVLYSCFYNANFEESRKHLYYTRKQYLHD